MFRNDAPARRCARRATAAAIPIATDSTISTPSGDVDRSVLRAWRRSAPRARRRRPGAAPRRARRSTSPASSSTASSSAGGSTTSSDREADDVEARGSRARRGTPGCPCSRANSGCATAKRRQGGQVGVVPQRGAQRGVAPGRHRARGRHGGAHARFGRAKKRTRVPDSSRSVRSIVERLGEAALEVAELVVGMQALALGGQQLLHHRVLAGRELDHERRAQRGEPVDELLDRHVGADRHVVHERQREHEVRPAAVGQRPALEAAPAEPGRRVGEVRSSAAGSARRPRRAGRGRAARSAPGRRRSRPPSARARRRCASSVRCWRRCPRPAPASCRGHLADEVVLARDVLVGVAVALAVRGPHARGRVPVQPLARACAACARWRRSAPC